VKASIAIQSLVLECGINHCADLGAADALGIREIDDLHARVLEGLLVTLEALGSLVVGADEELVEVIELPGVGILDRRIHDLIYIAAGADDLLALLEGDEGLFPLPLAAVVNGNDQEIALFLRAADQIQMSDMKQIKRSGKIADSQYLFFS